MTEYALEADPGQLTASFPTYPTYQDAHDTATSGAMHRDGLPDPRVLTRTDGDPWRFAATLDATSKETTHG